MMKNFFKHYLRNGALFKKLLNEFEMTEKFSAAELKQYQNEKLKNMIKSAVEGVPYYKNIFNKNKLVLSDIKCAEDLEKIPILDKEIVRSNFALLKKRNFFGLFFRGTTSGTTGTPAIFLRDLYSINLENSALWRQCRWAGKNPGSRRITFRGEIICPFTQQKPPFWKYDPWNHELKMSSYHLIDSNIKYYIDKIIAFNPYDLYAYPSIAYLIASFCISYNIQLHIPLVFTSSEMLLDFQKEAIIRAFGCKLYDWYGSAERVSAIGHCEFQTYHEFSDYSITEYLPAENGKYEIIGTTLHNKIMPLIRYRTGDLVEFPETNTCQCGRAFRKINHICGRNNDFIILNNGKKIRIHGLIFKGLPFVREAQIIQRSINLIEVNVVFSGVVMNKHKNILIKRINEFLGDEDIEVRIECVKRVERENGEKFKLVKSLVNAG